MSAMVVFDEAAARRTVAVALLDCHEAAGEFLAPTSPATAIPGARPWLDRQVMTESAWLEGMPSVALSHEWRLTVRPFIHEGCAWLVMSHPRTSVCDAVTPAQYRVKARAVESVLDLLVAGYVGCGQPAKILRSVRRIEAFAAKFRRLAEGRRRAAARILADQASAVEALEAAATMRVLGGGPRT